MDITSFFIPAPLSAIYTALIGCSMLIVFDFIGKGIFKSDALHARAMYFFAGNLVLSWLIFLLAAVDIISVRLYQAVPILFIVAAAGVLYKYGSGRYIELVKGTFSIDVNGTFPRILRAAVIFSMIAFFVISLAPPTDADSLDYHLGIPVEIIRNGSLWYSKDHLHFRMIGFGELFNIIGVSSGCAQLSAFIQYLALFWLLTVYTEKFSGQGKLNILVICLGVPLLLFLMPNQKSQFTGIACSCIFFYGLLQKEMRTNALMLTLISLQLIFIIGLKYSFAISACALGLLFLLSGYNKVAIGKFIGFTLLFACLLLGPLFTYKYLNFGDPLSPLFEAHTANPDVVVLAFHQFLKDFRDSAFPLPLNLLLPSSLSFFSCIIGIGTLILVSFFFRAKHYKAQAIAIGVYVVVTVLTGQKTARFFLEPFLWIVPIFVATASNKVNKALLAGARVQLLLVIPFLLFALYSFTPGIISDKGREKMMTANSIGYAESRWIDTLLPADARVCMESRSRALIPRPYFPQEYFAYYAVKNPSIDTMGSMLRRYKIDYLVLLNYGAEAFKEKFAGDLVASKTFSRATRNPMNKVEYTLSVFKVKNITY